MRYSLIFAVLLQICFAPSLALGQADLPVYTIQLGNFQDPKAEDFEGIRQYGFVYGQQLTDRLYRMFLGGFTRPEEAQQITSVLQSIGYQDASITQHNLAQGQEVKMIQLATRKRNDSFDWNAYARQPGDLYVYLENQQVKILTGPFPSTEAATQQLPKIRKNGFKDAFVKTVNASLLQLIHPQITGFLPPAPPAPVAEKHSNIIPPDQNIPKGYEEETVIPGTNFIPDEYEALTILKPAIRLKPKRTSALELQKVLKELGAYKMALDGFYGKGTREAYEATAKSHPQIKKYALLSAKESQQAADAIPGSLQYAVNNLPNNPLQSMQVFAQFSGPIPKIYQAYQFFITGGPSFDINNLMNSAIREAFANKERDPRSRFDHTASYAYNTIDQVVNHLLQVHAATGNKVAVPCWLFQRHSKTTTEAFEFYPTIASAGLNIEDCGGLLDWQEIRTLKALARDLQAGEEVNESLLADARSRQARLILSPKTLTENDAKAAEIWHKKLQNGIKLWETRDQMLKEIAEAFRVMYFQSDILLEDYYVSKGFSQRDAEALALATLQAMIGPYVVRFTKS